MKNKLIRNWLYILAALVIVSLVLTLLPQFTLITASRLVFGSLFILFLPGYLLSYIFFTRHIDLIERLALSVALSIAVVPLLVFYLNLLGMRISARNTFSTVLTLLLVEALVLFYKRKSGAKKIASK